MTPFEADEYRGKVADGTIKEQADAEIAKYVDEIKADAPMNAVRSKVFGQLEGVRHISKYTKAENLLQASAVARMYQRLADRLNEGAPEDQHKTAEDYWNERPMRLVSDAIRENQTLGQRKTTVEAETERWRTGLQGLGSWRDASTANMRTPVVLYHMGEKNPTLSLSASYLDKVVNKHPDVPPEVLQNLPALLHDPVAVFPHQEGGLNVLIDAKTENGDPMVVGVRDGKIRTITPVNGEEVRTGNDVLLDRIEEALKVKKGGVNTRVYYRGVSENNEPARSPEMEGAGSATARANAPLSLGELFRQRRNVTTREKLVNTYGEHYYQHAHDIGDISALADVGIEYRIKEDGGVEFFRTGKPDETVDVDNILDAALDSHELGDDGKVTTIKADAKDVAAADAAKRIIDANHRGDKAVNRAYR